MRNTLAQLLIKLESKVKAKTSRLIRNRWVNECNANF
jgi:hypothetical protein